MRTGVHVWVDRQHQISWRWVQPGESQFSYRQETTAVT